MSLFGQSKPKQTVPIGGDKARALYIGISLLAIVPVLFGVAVVAKSLQIGRVGIGSVAIDVVHTERPLIVLSASVAAQFPVLLDGCCEPNDGVFYFGCCGSIMHRGALAAAKDTQPSVHLIASKDWASANSAISDVLAFPGAVASVLSLLSDRVGFATRLARESYLPGFPEAGFRAKEFSDPGPVVLALERGTAGPTSVHGG
jgi:hypothetical protein